MAYIVMFLWFAFENTHFVQAYSLARVRRPHGHVPLARRRG